MRFFWHLSSDDNDLARQLRETQSCVCSSEWNRDWLKATAKLDLMLNKLFYLGIVSVGVFTSVQAGLALPPPEEIPEEVLRTEIITQARSPLTGERLSAAQYAELQERLAQSPFPPELDSRVRQTIFLLQIRKLLETINPF